MPPERKSAQDFVINAIERGDISEEKMQQQLALISESPAGQEKSKRIANTPESSSLMDKCTRLTGEAAEVCIAQH